MAARVVPCPHCESKVKAKDSLVGKWVTCPSCEGEFQIPNADEVASKERVRRRDLDDLESANRPVPLGDDEGDLETLDEAMLIDDEPKVRSKPAPRAVSSQSRRPAPRRRADEDDWEDREPTKSNNTALILGLVLGGGFCFVVLLAAAAFVFFWTRPNGKSIEVVQQVVPPKPHNPIQPTPSPQPDNANVQPQPGPMPPVIPQPVNPQPVVPPIVQAPQPNPAPIAANVLKYSWQPNREYPYRITIDATVGQTTERTTGICSYQVSAAPIAINTEPQKGSGTAFVISPDGLLVTCAHVVGDARTIEVLIGGQKYPAQIVAQNPTRDVALIRIQAQNLPTVPLGDSEAVQLAQTIRVIGFPLSDVLGQNIKVTTGTVSGLNQELSSKIIQTDASINPGNSGGPVANEFGEVIGIASAKLTGQDVSTVGFAVPINDVKTLLQQQQLNVPASAAAKQKLDGPLLAERITRATALVHVVVGASERRSNLKFSGNFSTIKSATGGGFGGIPAIPRVEVGNGQLVLDEFGKVLHFEGEQQLPYLLGPLGLMIVEPLSPSGMGGWSESSQTTITRIESDGSPFGMSGFRSRFRGPPGFPSPFEDKQKKTTYQASEQATYSLADTVNDFVGVKLKYELKSHDHPTNPFVHLRGEGLWQFNKKEGVPHSVELKMLLARNADNVQIKVPFTVRMDYVNPQALAEERRVAAERAVAVQKQNDEKSWEELQKLAPPPKTKLVQRYRFTNEDQPKTFAVNAAGEVLVATNTGMLRLYDRTKADPVTEWKLPSASVSRILFNSDGKLTAVAINKQIGLFDLATKQQTKLLDGTFFGFDQAALSPDGKRALGTTFKGEAEIFDVETGNRFELKIGLSNLVGLALSEDGQAVHAMSSDKYAVFTWDRNQPAVNPVTLNRGQVGHIWAARMAPNGDSVIVGSRDAWWWSASKNEVVKKLECPASHHRGLALSRKGDLFASSENKSVMLLDVEKNVVVERWDADPNSVRSIAFSDDGHYLLTLGNSRVLQLWELPQN